MENLAAHWQGRGKLNDRSRIIQNNSIYILLGLMQRTLVYIYAIVTTPVLALASPTPAPNRDEINVDARRMLEHMAWPFGRVDDADIDRLQDFALRCGFDFRAEMARVYGEKKLDEDALARVFIFSRQFNRLDKNARTYGHIIHCSLLNIGEVIGVPAYVKIIDRQPPEVQQRVRDFLWYPAWHDQHKQNDGELESVYPGLFPKSYKFGRDDPIFANET